MSILAIVSKSEFEKALVSPTVGDLWKQTTYVSSNPALDSLRQGGDLYLVTVRPGDQLWLAAVLRSPKTDGKGWTARPNAVPLLKATSIVKKLRFTSGKGLAFGPGKLGMSLQTPRQLTDDDVAQFEKLIAPTGAGAKARATGKAAKATAAKATTAPAKAKAMAPTKTKATTHANPKVAAKTTKLPSEAGSGSPVARRIIDTLDLPAGLADAPLTGPWRGPLKHIGPDRFTPLKQSLLDKTNGAIYALLSGVMLWGAERLRALTDVAPLEDLALALFCFQQDARYLRRPAKITDLDTIESRPRAEATVLYLLDSVYQDHIYERGMWSDLPMWGTAAEAINLVRHNLPASAATAFDRWLGRVIARLDRLAPFDDPGEVPTFKSTAESQAWRAKVMGQPLPPSVLDLSVEPRPAKFADEWRGFLSSLDWAASIHLRPPKELAKAGVKGTPYQNSRRVANDGRG